MDVKSLIAELEKLNPDAKIFIPFDYEDDSGWEEVSGISFRPVEEHSDSRADSERYWDAWSGDKRKPIIVIV